MAKVFRSGSGLPHWMDEVARQYKKASKDLDVYTVHDLRVALRRCRTMAKGLREADGYKGWKKMSRAAKGVFKALGALRDVQVMKRWVAELFRESSERATVIGYLSGREACLKHSASQALDAFDLDDWRDRKKDLTNHLEHTLLAPEVFRRMASSRLDEALLRHQEAVEAHTDEAFHQVRIGFKRFRYTVENFLPELYSQWKPDLKRIQDLLGEAHDLTLLEADICGKAPRLSRETRSRWQVLIDQARRDRIDEYLALTSRSDHLWDQWRKGLTCS